MRILFVNEKLGWFGGVEQNVGDAALGLRARGHECFLAWGEKTQRQAGEYEAIFDGAARSACFGSAGGGEVLSDIVARFAPHAIYVHKIARIPDELVSGIGTRAVRMVHDHDLCCPRHHKYFAHNARICHHPAGWRCWLDGAFLERDRSSVFGVRWRSLAAHREEMLRNQRLDLLLVGSRFMRDELEMNGFAGERVAVLPPVVRMKPVEATDAAQEPLVLYVGQLIRGKGVDLLLRALALLRCPYRALVIGDGNARAALEVQAAELGLGNRVVFAGWVPNHELGSHYASARVLAVPARWPEPFGMIGLEAMQHARPVVGFRAGGLEDWLVDGETGLLVPEQDIAAYATALEKLLTDRELAVRLGRGGLSRVRSEYSFDSYIDRLEAHLSGADPTGGPT